MKTVSARPNKRTRSMGGPQGLAESEPCCLGLNLFADLTDAELSALLGALEAVSFPDGALLMSQGLPGDELFLLEYGAVRVTVREGEAAPFVREIQAPATLGEMALVTDAPRTATVEALGAVRCFRLGRRQFEGLILQHPDVAQVLTRLVGERLCEIDGIRKVGKYTVTGVLGDGGVAQVFSARHPDLGSEVALKMLSHGLAHHPQFAAAFDDEARIIAGLKHPNVVRVFDTERAYGTRFIVMERLDGRVLEAVITDGPRMSWPQISQLLQDILHALHHVHQHGLVHRDVKPDNIFMGTDTGAKLIDFGIAIAIDRSATLGEERLGTPYYMPPEQILGHALDGRSDLYALGLTAYEMVTQKVAFDAPSLRGILKRQLDEPTPDPRRRAPQMPECLAEFISRATAKAPEDRFADCAEAAEFLACSPPDKTALKVVCDVADALVVQAALRRAQAELEAAGVTTALILS